MNYVNYKFQQYGDVFVGGCQTSMKSGVPYAMSKAAISQMSYNLSVEWAPDNIRVNVVAPWYIATPLTKPVLDNPEAYQAVIDRTPMKRIGIIGKKLFHLCFTVTYSKLAMHIYVYIHYRFHVLL